MIACDSNCGCGTACKCSQSASAHVAALHARLVREHAKIAELTAQVKMHEGLAQVRQNFNQCMLDKEVELIHLQAQLELANERAAMSKKIAVATATNAQLEASLRIAKSQAESMKQQIAKRNHEVATALADSKAINAKLTKQIVALEKQLESLNVRMAEKPTESQVQ